MHCPPVWTSSHLGPGREGEKSDYIRVCRVTVSGTEFSVVHLQAAELRTGCFDRNTKAAMGDSGSSVTQGGLQSVEYSSILDFKAMKEVYRGRHSIVWRCQCKRTKDPLVVKGYVKEKMRVRHFQQVSREVSLMQKCRVAGIVRFAGSFEDTKCIYIVQEDCSNGDLFQMLNDCGGVMTEKDVVLRVRANLPFRSS